MQGRTACFFEAHGSRGINDDHTSMARHYRGGPGLNPQTTANIVKADQSTLSRRATSDSAGQLARSESGREILLRQKWNQQLSYDENNDNLFLVHVYEPSNELQGYDVTIYLMRHVWRADNQTQGFKDVEKAYFYFGPSWRNKVFEVVNLGEHIGVRVSAWGRFLATCLVTYKSGKSLTLCRYIDFEMASRVSS